MMKLYNINDMIKLAKNKPKEIIENGILPERALLLISGFAKNGKSLLAYNLSLALASGYSFACFKITRPYKVLMISAEGGRHNNSGRFSDMDSSIVHMRDKVADNLSVSFISRLWLNIENEKEELIKTLEQVRPDILVLDPFIRFHNLDENTANQMGEIFSIMRVLIDTFKLSIILVHHHGKGSKEPRGSSVIMGEYDSSIRIEKSKNFTTLSFDLRHAESPDPVKLSLSDTLWFSPYGELATEKELLAKLFKEGPIKKKSLAVQIMEKLNVGKSKAYELKDHFLSAKLIREYDDQFCLV